MNVRAVSNSFLSGITRCVAETQRDQTTLVLLLLLMLIDGSEIEGFAAKVNSSRGEVILNLERGRRVCRDWGMRPSVFVKSMKESSSL